MEFKAVQEEIRRLEKIRSYLSDNGEQSLAEFKELLKQRNEMLKMLIEIDEKLKHGKAFQLNLWDKRITKLIEEATKID